MVVEAKYWDRLEEYRQQRAENKARTDKNREDDAKSLSPSDQILKYLEILQLDFGILTDGKTWRLYHKDQSKGDVRRYFEFDLGNLADLVRDGLEKDANSKEFYEQAKYFYFMFRKQSFVQTGSVTPLAYELLEYSKKYAIDVEEDLRKRFIQAMGYICNAIWENSKTQKASLALEQIRSTAESHLFNVLFIRSCETRKILPIHASDYLRISLTEIIECLDYMRFDPTKDLVVFEKHFKKQFGQSFRFEGFEIYDRLLRLYSLVQNGDVGFGIQGFKESVFGEVEWSVIKSTKICNEAMLRALFALSFTETGSGNRKYQQIPYQSFTPRQLGSIYESFLEFKLDRAEQDLIFSGGQWRSANLSSSKVRGMQLDSEAVVKKGNLYFTPDNADRKVTGSYYTPEFVVDYMTASVIDAICENVRHQNILELSVCDPACGSGHFLNTALQYLTFKYREKVVDETLDDIHETFEESARKVLRSCIFGSDLNPRAVKLARLSLWLTTASINKKLEKLSDQLIEGNSLTEASFEWTKQFPEVFKKGGFDAMLGNPPYVDSERMIATDAKVRAEIGESFETAKGNWDLYIPFIELGHRKLRKNGRLAFIIPNKWIAVDYAKALREYILEDVDSVVDCSGTKVFEQGNNPIVLMLTKDSNSKEIRKFRFNSQRIVEPNGQFKKSELSADWGILLASNSTALQSVIAHRKTVGAIYSVENPFSVSEAYEIKPMIFDGPCDEKRDLRFLNTGTIDRFVSLWGRKPTTYIKEKYDRPVVRRSKFKAAFPKRFDQSTSPKLIITGMRYFEVFFDDAGTYIAGKSTIIVRGGKGQFDLVVLLGFLNSKLVSFYLNNLYSTQGIDGGINFTTKMVSGIPIPDDVSEFKEIRSLVSRLARAYNGKGTVKDIKSIPDLEKELDTRVYKSYGLKKNEVEEVEAFFHSKKKKKSKKPGSAA